MKIERLIAIIMLLLEREVVPTSELTEKLEVSRRTIFRDIDTLNMAGLPIMTTRGSNGGVSLMKTYKVDNKLFTPKDVHSLITSLKSYYQLLENKEIANTLIKLESMTEGDDSLKQNFHDEYFSIDLEPSQGNRSLKNLLKVIEKAIKDKQYLLFDYIDINGKASVRKVEPYKVIFKESSWYLQAFSLEKNDYRVFKLARMSKVRLSEEIFTPKNFVPIPMNCTDWMTKHRVPVTIKIDKSIKDKVIERFGEEYIIANNGNVYLAKYPIIDNENGYNELLKFGIKCEIIEPLSVRENFKKYLQNIFDKYIEKT
ncbi:helix-turn-helix transcriptional regulator [Chengkuizengella sediminis]|uniref:helix-turn-helix transcriptional regulator n=1 Tax=Chengkuizengella sediminis TaxID=1885917 RepID=UPI001389EC8D|nr:YafY family protein [Chengkuizengella sediminis]NDI35751.1 YafY family transcriptional regulator [Chengkuizengella sediminis]